MDAMCGSTAPALPVDLVVQVLLLIDQKQRFESCALVNHVWRRAADLACSEVTCRLSGAAQCRAFSSWLHRNSACSRISSMDIENCRVYSAYIDIRKLARLQLPVTGFEQLRTLRLKACKLLPATPASAASATAVGTVTSSPLAALTALRTLQLEDCLVNIDSLGSCTNLQHLQLKLASAAPPNDASNSSSTAAAEAAAGTMEAAIVAALPQLQQLTSLCLDKSNQEKLRGLQFGLVSSALSSLQQLQELEIGWRVNLPESSLAYLPVSIRRIKMTCCHFGSKQGPSLEVAPYLQRLTNLQHLHLHRMHLYDPELLLSCTQLTCLKLTEVKLESEDPDADEEDAAVSLLEVLQDFRQLQHLNLTETLQADLYEFEPYAGLTASSHLTTLDISFCCLTSRAVSSMFAADRQCSSLLKASLSSQLFEYAEGYELLVSRCPALRCLNILYPWVDYVGSTYLKGISALQSLTNLTNLYFYGVQLSDDALASIAQCQQLIDLSLVVSGVSVEGLQHLTLLTALTRLDFTSLCSHQPEDFDLTDKAPAGSPPDVHQQLRCNVDKQKKMQQAAGAAATTAG